MVRMASNGECGVDVDWKNVTGEPYPHHFSFRHDGKCIPHCQPLVMHVHKHADRLKTQVVTNRSNESSTHAKT